MKTIEEIGLKKNDLLAAFYNRCKNIKSDIKETDDFQFFQQGYLQRMAEEKDNLFSQTNVTCTIKSK